MKFGKRMIYMLLFSSLSTSIILAESSAEARQWLDKVAELYGSPFKANFGMAVGGADASLGNIAGVMTIGEKGNMRMQADMKVNQAGQEMDINFTMVMDGAVMWLEMKMPAMGMHQVMKLPIDKMTDLGNQNQLMAMLSQDPTAQMKKMADTLDFMVEKREGGKVFLVAKPTKEQLEKMTEGLDQMPADLNLSRIEFILDEKATLPMTMNMGDGTANFLEMTLSNYKKLTSQEMKTSFQYTPPEGVPVMDMSAMLQGESGQ